MQLTPCDGCRRHLSVGEGHCPFCGLERAASPAQIAGTTSARPRSRRALLLGTALAAAIAGCGGDAADETTTQEEPGTGTEPTSGGESGGPAEIERTGGEAPAADAGPSGGGGAQSPPPEDPGGVVALYGVAPAPED